MGKDEKNMSVWEHLDELRGVLWRALLVWAAAFVVCFALRDPLFRILFAPSQSDFCLYRALCRMAELTGWQFLCPDSFDSHFISTELTSQFMTHLSASLWAGLVVASPYIIILLYRFVSPALYEKERRFSGALVAAAGCLFLAGVLLNYFLIFPLSYRFLATYQVQADVVNTITLSSYISSFLVLSLMMGVMFELPVVTWFLSHIGLVDRSALRRYRKHAFVIIMIVAAVITPTGDAVTLLIVTLPVYLLYEISILAAK
ncbi:MAG: twin-arginine translocase subunit TatC [Paludibacteraceae bacterium]|nr:twin-arginine translocase subunit TatC [Paludibacteraceae bacterium]